MGKKFCGRIILANCRAEFVISFRLWAGIDLTFADIAESERQQIGREAHHILEVDSAQQHTDRQQQKSGTDNQQKTVRCSRLDIVEVKLKPHRPRNRVVERNRCFIFCANGCLRDGQRHQWAYGFFATLRFGQHGIIDAEH